MKNLKNGLLLISLLFFALIFTACGKKQDTKDRIYLDSNWQYSLKGEPYKFYDLPDNNLDNLSSLIDGKIGYIFIKTKFYLPKNYKHRDIALYIGRIKIASKIYINNHTLGKTGVFPPHEFTEGNKSFAFKIPKEYLHEDGENTILICLWCRAYGSISSTPFISDYTDAETVADY